LNLEGKKLSEHVGEVAVREGVGGLIRILHLDCWNFV
jgi:hypothetical protein